MKYYVFPKNFVQFSLDEMMEFVVVAVFFAGIAGFVLLLVFHKNGKYEIPFVPFLFLSWFVTQGLGIAEGII